MTLQAGWLKRQMEHVSADVERWPEWMKREAIFADSTTQDARGAGDTATEIADAPHDPAAGAVKE